MSDARPSLYDLLLAIKPDDLTPNSWASRAGVSRSWFTDVRNGANPRTDTLEKVLGAIGMTPAQFHDLQADTGVRASIQGPSKALPFRGRSEPMDLPLMGTAQASDLEVKDDGTTVFVERMDLDMDNVVEMLRRPPTLAGRDDVYAISTLGTSMMPKFEDGDPAYVESRRQPRQGDYVVVQLARPEGQEGRVYLVLLKRLVRRTSDFIELEQLNPPLRFTVPLKDVHAIHRVKPWREIVFF
jgi:SOS-response transcriptional repressor LexA